MDISFEYIDPFDEKYDYLMRVEHLARYYFAANAFNGFNNVLDVACANGYGTKILSEIAEHVTGIDKNSDYLKEATEKNASDNITYLQMDQDNEELEGCFDGIACFETIEHLKHPEDFLRNLFNVLTNNGTLILSFPNSAYEIIEDGKNKDPYHLHVFEFDEISNLLKSIGFKIEEVYGQSYTNKIVNNKIDDYKLTTLIEDAKTISYPSKDDIDNTYSCIFVLKKEK